jgi:branched-chain amino acid transport system permease protein
MAPHVASGKGMQSAHLRRGANGLWVLIAAAALLVAHWAVGSGSYNETLLTLAFIYGIAAISLDVVWGYAGIPDLGHAMWFGIGALSVGASTAVLSSAGLTTGVHGGFSRYALGFVIGVAAATAMAGLVGKFSFVPSASAAARFYVAVVTLALTTAATTLYTQVSWTGGENGLYGFQVASISNDGWYYISGVLLFVVILLALVFVRSDYGLLMRAVRDNERRIRYLAYDVERTKTAVFMVGAAFAAAAGGLFGMSFGLSSSSLFSFLLATQMLVWVAVGGRGTVIGPAIGAILLSLISSELNERYPAQWAMFVGLLFVAVVVFIPDGALPYVARLARRVVGARWPQPAIRRLVVDPDAGEIGHQDSDRPVITVRDLGFSYGSLHVLRGVDLDIRLGELLCIVGPNGAGKSTLMELLTDGKRKHTGTITVNLAGARHAGSAAQHIARLGIIRKFQVPSLFESLTVAETVLLASRRGKRPSIWRRSTDVRVWPPVVEVLEAVGLSGRENTPAAELSHGLKQGLEIAAAVATRPKVIILDEPTAGLTANERRVVGDILVRLASADLGVVLIEHDLDFVQRVADRIAVLHDGRVVETGTPKQVAESEVVLNAYVGAVKQ